MKEGCSIVKGYRTDDALRASFNRLAKKTFRLDFEGWYQNGYWTDKYNPYSVVYKNEVVATVAASPMEFMENGRLKHYVQLGTVMTEEVFRRQGLSRVLMEEIFKDYGEWADGFFLFANDSVLNFYPKFGFRVSKEYRYSKPVCFENEQTAVRVPMTCMHEWKELWSLISESKINSAFELINNEGLIMFYLSQFMKNNVYYVENAKTYAVAELEDDKLILHALYSIHGTPESASKCLEEVIKAFGCKISRVELSFTPLETRDYELKEYHCEDCTLFVKGKGFEGFEDRRLSFSELAHT